MPNIWHICHTKHKKPSLSDVPNAIIFATCYSILTYLPLYGQMWQMLLLFFYSSFSLISPSVSPSNPNPLLSNPNPHCSSTPTLTIESGIKPDNELDAKDTFFSKIKSPNEVGISTSSEFNKRFKDSRYAFSVTEVGIFPLSLLAGFGSDEGGWV